MVDFHGGYTGSGGSSSSGYNSYSGSGNMNEMMTGVTSATASAAGSAGKFVCPSDRQLALRAKLHTGWSAGRATGPLKPEEQAAIISVIRRNEILESAERLRVGKLVERVEKIKQRAADCGPRYCRLCGQSFGLLGPSKLICEDCHKPVCSKCSIEIQGKSPTRIKESWLCKICSETREMWKKSGAWFFKGLPKYELPQRSASMKSIQRDNKPKAVRTTKLGMQLDDTSTEEEEDLEEGTVRTISDAVDGAGSAVTLSTSYRFGNGGLGPAGKIYFTEDTNILNQKKSPLSPYSRQTSSSESQQSASIVPPNMSDWETLSMGQIRREITPQLLTAQQRRGSITSSWSVSETSTTSGGNPVVGNAITGVVGQMCRETPVGWLEMQLNYDEGEHTLECTVLRARDLPPMDSSGLADPFGKLNIITADGTQRQARWMRTKTVHKTKNPEFNETVTFLGIEAEELVNAILYIVLLDDDKYGHDFLGAAKLNLSAIIYGQTTTCRMCVPLGTDDQFSMDASGSGPWPRGQILISLSYNTKRRALIVNVKRCINLVSMDNNGFSDPFIKLQLKPDPHRRKHKTTIKWRNLNPVFNEEFAFETRPNDLDKQSLIITVWDKDLGKSNDFLGSLIIGVNSKGRRLKQWKDCVRIPDHFHEQWHCLSSETPHH